MAYLYLTPEECALLVDVLDGALSDLHSEISGTDRPEYRDLLRERRETLARIRASIESADSAEGADSLPGPLIEG